MKMGTEEIKLDQNSELIHKTISIAYLCKWSKTDPLNGCGILEYLQNIRSGTLKVLFGDEINNPKAEAYEQQKEEFSIKLSSIYDNNFDLIVSPPSRYKFADIYRNKFIEKNSDLTDLTNNFTRTQDVFSGATDTDYDSLYNSIKFKSTKDISKFRSILIVDDIISSSRTLSVIVKILEENGLNKSSQLFAACPLYIC